VSEIRGHVLWHVKFAEDSNESPKFSEVEFNETQTFWNHALHSKKASWNIDKRLSPQTHSESGTKLIVLDM